LNYFTHVRSEILCPAKMISDATHPVGSVNPDGVPVKFQAPVTDRATAIALLGTPQNNIIWSRLLPGHMSLFKSFSRWREQACSSERMLQRVEFIQRSNPECSMNANGGLISGQNSSRNNTPDARFFHLALKYLF